MELARNKEFVSVLAMLCGSRPSDTFGRESGMEQQRWRKAKMISHFEAFRCRKTRDS